MDLDTNLILSIPIETERLFLDKWISVPSQPMSK